jgi:predicted GNAT superfamily acetyltransferase
VVVAEVNVEPRNDVSMAFHERYGFRTVAEVDDPRYDHLRVAMVELSLPRPISDVTPGA